MPKVKAAHHRGTFHVRSQLLREAAYQSPLTRCWRCALTLHEAQAAYPTRRVHWTAGHIIDGLPDGPMAAECSPCNYGHGARKGNRIRGLMRRRDKLNTSRQW